MLPVSMLPILPIDLSNYLTYNAIAEQIENWMQDDNSKLRTIIDEEINNVYLSLLYPTDEVKATPWLIEDATLTTIDGQQVYDDSVIGASNLAQDINRLVAISVDYKTVRILTDPKDIETYSKKYRDATIKGRPGSCFLQKAYDGTGSEINELWFFKRPDAAYVSKYWFERRVAKLVNPNDVPRLPNFAHMALVYGTLITLSLMDIPLKSGAYAELYKGIKGNLNRFRNNQSFNSKYTVPQVEIPLVARNKSQ